MEQQSEECERRENLDNSSRPRYRCLRPWFGRAMAPLNQLLVAEAEAAAPAAPAAPAAIAAAAAAAVAAAAAAAARVALRLVVEIREWKSA